MENINENIEKEIQEIAETEFGVEKTYYSQSMDVSEIDKGLIEFHKQSASITKKGKADAGKFSYTYATLDSILEEVNEKLVEQNLYIMQMPINVGDDRLAIRTSIRSGNGQFMTMDSVSFKYRSDIQSLGGYITYLKRYSLSALLAISFSEDTDCLENKIANEQSVSSPTPTPPTRTGRTGRASR